jgi:hypothetical protein
MNTNEMIKYDMMVELGVATPEEINLVRCLMSGSWNTILDNIVYAREGYHTFEEYLAELDEDEE